MDTGIDGGRGEHAGNAPRVLWIAMLVVFFLMAIRIASINSPVMGSDEYAYFHAAKYEATGDRLYALDPYLQRVDNKVYPWLYRAWASGSVEHAATVGRLFNSLLYCLGALLLFGVFRRCMDRRSALLSALLYLAMPFSFYATTLLPEVEFQLSIYLLALVWLAERGASSWRQVVLAALVSATSYLIKPHAAAAILASAAYLVWSRAGLAAGGSALKRMAHGMLQAVGYLACTVVLIKLLRYALDPAGSSAIVASFYQGYLDQLRDPQYLLKSLGSIAGYVGGHVWVWLVFFAPGVVALLVDLRHWLPWRRAGAQAPAVDDAIDESRRKLTLFLFLLAAAMLCMVALFTDAAAAGSEFERGRLHGRYVEALLPFLLAYGVWWSGRGASRWVALLGFAAMATFVLWGRFWFHLYPWDYPDLFGLFDRKIPYWGFDHVVRWPLRLSLVLALVCWAAFAFTRHRRFAYLVFVAGSMLAAHGQMSAWLKAENGLTRQVLADGAAIRAFLGEDVPGTGLVATYERFGQASYLLAAMDTQQHVLELAPGAALDAQRVPKGIRWVVAPAAMEVRLPQAWKIDLGSQRLYLLEDSRVRPVAPQKPLWDGQQPLQIDTGSAANPARFQGFRPGEGWGRWSTAQRSNIELPALVSGRVRVEFFGWVADVSKIPSVSVGLGNAVASVPMTAQGQEHQLVLEVKTPTDSLWFESATVNDGGVPLGVAVGRIRVTAVP
ncbi:glycosyltransferase family 39 protein [Dyella sp. 2RAB6]|uniref:glycosyltransferase family 39 protein n=1 Tax=Dyella sp. 2RAB6 TaxID=3232992 RepID=UPI003F93CAC6